MQHLQWQKGEGSARQAKPLYIVPSYDGHINEVAFEKGSQLLICYRCKSETKTDQLASKHRNAKHSELTCTAGLISA